jgi:hypothetical protein
MARDRAAVGLIRNDVIGPAVRGSQRSLVLLTAVREVDS